MRPGNIVAMLLLAPIAFALVFVRACDGPGEQNAVIGFIVGLVLAGVTAIVMKLSE